MTFGNFLAAEAIFTEDFLDFAATALSFFFATEALFNGIFLGVAVTFWA